MSDNTIPPRSTVTLNNVKGDLEVGRHAIVKGEGSPPRVEVSGTIYVEDDCLFECDVTAENLDADGDVTVKGELEIRNRVSIDDGRLVVDGNMTATRADVGKSIRVGKNLKVKDVDVGGSLEVEGATTAQSIDVGGTFSARGEVEAHRIDVGGSVRIESKVNIEDVDVGGTVRVEGGKITRVDVGGSFVSRDSLEFEEINVGGTVKIAGKSKAATSMLEALVKLTEI